MQHPRVIQYPAPRPQQHDRLHRQAPLQIVSSEGDGSLGVDGGDEFEWTREGGVGRGFGEEVDADAGVWGWWGASGCRGEGGEGEDDGDAVETGAVVEGRDVEFAGEEPVVVVSVIGEQGEWGVFNDKEEGRGDEPFGGLFVDCA